MMTTIHIAVIQFPGSNCERETALAIKRAGMEPVEFLWNENTEKLAACAGYVIVGGFSYEDRSRAGIIAALDPVMQVIKAEAATGKPVLGICNGAQILVETGLVPGLENNKLALALTENKRMANGKILGTGYYNAWVHLRLAPNYQRNAFTQHLNENTLLHVPVAHAEGRFLIAPALLQEMENQGLGVFRYCDENGAMQDEFPINPNGSTANIAAIANKQGNVMAMMPHPERTKVGDVLFTSMRDYILAGSKPILTPLNYYPRRETLKTYRAAANVHECCVELMITDNHALTVQQTLQQLGLPVKVKRQVHWEINASETTLQAIKRSGVLYNPRKEIEKVPAKVEKGFSYLVRPKEDWHGLQKQQMLKDHFEITDVKAIKQATLWHFIPLEPLAHGWQEKLLATHIIANPYAHDYYHYE